MGRTIPLIGGGGGGWTPASKAGLLAWSKADAGVYADSGATLVSSDWQEVIQWNDQSGNNNHFLQNDKPLYRASILGGIKGLHFNAKGLSSMRLTSRLTNVKTIFIAYKRQGVSGVYDEMFSDNSGFGSSPYITISGASVEWDPVYGQAALSPFGGATWYKNGVSINPLTEPKTLSLDIMIITVTSDITLDNLCNAVAGAGGQGAEVFEVGFYDSTLNSTEVGTLYSYLSARWSESGTQSPEFIFDAGSITGLSNNDPISTWPDDTGNGHTATASGALRPIYKTGAVNSRPAAEFSTAAASRMNIPTGGTRISYLVAVYKSLASSYSYYGVLVGSSETAGAPRVSLFYNATTGFYITAATGLAHGRRNKVDKWNNDSLGAIDSWNCLTICCSASSYNHATLFLGGNEAGYTIDMQLAEVRGYKDPLTLSQLQSIEDALIAKYAL
jgi:hypothetical protein